jgi:hypothetical protein
VTREVDTVLHSGKSGIVKTYFVSIVASLQCKQDTVTYGPFL